MDALKELVGTKHGFYGVDNNFFKLGKKVYEAIEDPDDDYRSYLGSIEASDRKDLIFFKQPVAKVEVIVSVGGYRLVDDSGHIWLDIGTDYSDDYYPCFFFTYYPKQKE